MQLSLLSAISFSHLPQYSLGHHQNRLSLTLFFLFLLNPVLSYLQKLPKLSPHLGKPNRSITQNSADICHAPKPGWHGSVGFARRVLPVWVLPSVTAPLPDRGLHGYQMYSNKGNQNFPVTSLALSWSMSDEDQEGNLGMGWCERHGGGYESGPWWTSQGQPRCVPAPLPTSCCNNHTDPDLVQPRKQTCPCFPLRNMNTVLIM